MAMVVTPSFAKNNPIDFYFWGTEIAKNAKYDTSELLKRSVRIIRVIFKFIEKVISPIVLSN